MSKEDKELIDKFYRDENFHYRCNNCKKFVIDGFATTFLSDESILDIFRKHQCSIKPKNHNIQRFIDSIKNEEIEDIMRAKDQTLCDRQRQNIESIKEWGNVFYRLLDFYKSEEISIAKIKLQECVMWAVKGISR